MNTIYNFKESKSVQDWYIVDDRVMGGLSKGNIKISDSGTAIYYGDVTTANNGGFSSLRHQFKSKNVSNYKAVVIRLKGDEKTYQFRIKSNINQRYSYVSSFKTNREWETIIIPFENFVPQFRGYRVNVPKYDGKQMQEIAFLLGNKLNESFQLEIESINLVK
ncbi:CIA30 family protein [Pontimicrobium aquaticum]|uniref:CIA30 family protein n=1 Tax=Pontimicrobium aquaticum TaxID=2565367 RepID=UPI001EF03F79|nr:CIA30 family protein [Pontimicrobium aquaticum]